MRIFFLFVMGIMLSFGGAWASDSPQQIRDEAFPILSEGLELFDAKKDVDERTLADRVTCRDAKFQRIVKECFEIMADSPLLDLLKLQDDTRAQIRQKQEKIGELMRASITAPESSWNPLTPTQESITKDVEKLRRETKELQEAFDRQKEEVYARIVANGVPMEREQFELMLNAADAMETAGIMAVAENLKYLLQSVERKATEQQAPVELLQTCSGMCMMCYRVYMYAIHFAVEQMDVNYLPRLASMRKENEDLLQEARRLASQKHTESDRKALKANMASQKRMIEVVDLYSRYLNSQKKRLSSLYQDMEKRYQVAVNTYHTIRLGTELLGLIRNTQTDFSRIFTFRPPELMLLHDDRFSREFAEVTANLRGN